MFFNIMKYFFVKKRWTFDNDLISEKLVDIVLIEFKTVFQHIMSIVYELF